MSLMSGSHGVTGVLGILKQHIPVLLSEGGCSNLSLLHQTEGTRSDAMSQEKWQLWPHPASVSLVSMEHACFSSPLRPPFPDL